MPKLATWLNSDSKPVAHADKRLANRFLKYWEGLRGDQDFPLISDLNLDHVGEFVPYIFNIDLSSSADDPKFRFLGRQLVRDCGGDITNQGISRLLPRSCLARAIERRGEVVTAGKPCMIADEFVNADGDKVLYRAVMMPFSSTGDTIDFIIGAINSKTVKLSRAAAPAPRESEDAEAAPAAASEDRPVRAGASPQETANRGVAPRNRSEVADLIAQVSAAMCEEAPADASSGPAESAPQSASALPIPREGGIAPRGRIIVVGSEKGGTGKSTTAIHLAVSLLYDGHKVGCIDLDTPQSSLGRYIENRQTLNRQHGLNLPVPDQVGSSGPVGGTGLLEEDLRRLSGTCDFVVVDTPGSDSAISRMAHSWAGIVVTPINDSFVDLDTLAVLDSEGKQILRRGHYAEMVANARKQKLSRTGEGFDWIVLRNRLSNLEARNKNNMADAMEMLAGYLDFRIGAGLSERVIYRELFLKGLTLLDLREQRAGVALSMSHVAARQELRALVQSIGISAADAAREARAVATF
jgi:chromosome partitioning protein